MGKFILCMALMGSLMAACPGYAGESDAILGDWITEDKDCRVEIFKRDHRYFGKIAAIKPPNYLPGEISGMDGKPRLDSNNQNTALRSRTLVGIDLMENFRFHDGKWIDGRVYDPKEGKTYSCEISVAKDGTLHVRGYIGLSLLGRTTVWERAQVYCKKELAFLGLSENPCR